MSQNQEGGKRSDRDQLTGKSTIRRSQWIPDGDNPWGPPGGKDIILTPRYIENSEGQRRWSSWRGWRTTEKKIWACSFGVKAEVIYLLIFLKRYVRSSGSQVYSSGYLPLVCWPAWLVRCGSSWVCWGTWWLGWKVRLYRRLSIRTTVGPWEIHLSSSFILFCFVFYLIDNIILVFLFCLFLGGQHWGLSSCLLGRYSYHLTHSTSPPVLSELALEW
jgi:hypothetical protein